MLTKIKFHKKTLGHFGDNGRFGSERCGGVTITRSKTQVFHEPFSNAKQFKFLRSMAMNTHSQKTSAEIILTYQFHHVL